ncbi:MAG TPA: DEAD/DEAH box helicase, partial [Sphingobium sp.]|nr:DEAD/DEAH box helicase [Sphingobium sp.]
MTDATAGYGEVALQLARALDAGDLLYLADDDQAAEDIAAALDALGSPCPVIFLPSSDTLPGDRAPASPANIGRRVSALRKLRRLAQDRQRAPLALIMSGEAAARLYPAPASLDAAPPTLHVGDSIDMHSFAADMLALGYVTDDRVDEPGEIAVRGDLIDIFPSDAGMPARIDVAQGRIAGIRRYDPATQLTEQRCDTLEVGRANEPDGGAESSILGHLRAGRIYRSAKAEDRRQRFIRLATQAAGDGKIDAVSQERWAEELAAWAGAQADRVLTDLVPRFVEKRAPLPALKRFAAPLLEKDRRLLLVGSERDLRFLRPRIAKLFQTEVETVSDLRAIDTMPPDRIAALVAPIHEGVVDDRLVM